MSSSINHTYAVGDVVIDKEENEDPEANPMVVVAVTGQSASDYAWTWDAQMNPTTVADSNPEYSETAPVVEVAYFETLDGRFDDWRSQGPTFIAEQADRDRVKTYSYPEPRLDSAPTLNPF